MALFALAAGLLGVALTAAPASAVSPAGPACLSPAGEPFALIERLRDGLDVYVVEGGGGVLRVEAARCAAHEKLVVVGHDPAWKTQYAINEISRLVADARLFSLTGMAPRLTTGLGEARRVKVVPGECPCEEED